MQHLSQRAAPPATPFHGHKIVMLVISSVFRCQCVLDERGQALTQGLIASCVRSSELHFVGKLAKRMRSDYRGIGRMKLHRALQALVGEGMRLPELDAEPDEHIVNMPDKL